MATILEKKLLRESTVEIDGKPINVFLRPDQSIEMKLKGQRGEGPNIPIKDLYNQLTGRVEEDDEEDDNSSSGGITVTNTNKEGKFRKNPTLNQFLADLRSQNAIADLDYETKAKFDGIIKNFIESQK